MALFGEDYLWFMEELLEERADEEAELIWRLLELEPGMPVLDLACGHGRIANRLASRGAVVTGLDATPLFLAQARQHASDRGLEVEYVEGDMRALPWTDRFDRIVLRDGETRRFRLFVRTLTFTESVDGYGRAGEPLNLEDRRMITVARKPA